MAGGGKRAESTPRSGEAEVSELPRSSGADNPPSVPSNISPCTFRIASKQFLHYLLLRLRVFTKTTVQYDCYDMKTKIFGIIRYP